ncbi:MAG: lysylphosphatidylglycerol synthase transmembrane domain-containing protein [Pseudomonadota bacterium]
MRIPRSIRAIVSCGLLVFSVYILDFTNVKNMVLTADKGNLIISAVLDIIALIVMSKRWEYLLSGILHVKPKEVIGPYLYSSFLNLFTPANLAGDVYRLFYFAQTPNLRGSIFRVIILERLFGLWASFTLGLGASFLLFGNQLNDKAFIAILVSSIGFSAGISLLLLLPKIGLWFSLLFRSNVHIVSKFFSSFPDYFNVGLKTKAIACISSLIVQILWCLAVYETGRALGIHVSFVLYLWISIVTECVRLIPITIQGIGIREGSFATLFAMFGYLAEDGFALAAVAYIVYSLVLCVSGLVGIILKEKATK